MHAHPLQPELTGQPEDRFDQPSAEPAATVLGKQVDTLHVSRGAVERVRIRHPPGDRQPRHADDVPVQHRDEAVVGGGVPPGPGDEPGHELLQVDRWCSAGLVEPVPPERGDGGQVLGSGRSDHDIAHPPMVAPPPRPAGR
ncbi:hypothetical protein HNR10_002563 [Nocardiopsis aegyptia]|uniref:Uncharacterized protein n=1 Tax=Nocardiopsis aegyptia TaxID=220378 RepID=A0A7Z0JAE0_9ACTN|nr:hypothetical protein [Nocardiopsis aegyptia]